MSRTALDASPRWFEVPHKVVERGLGSLFVDTERPDGWRILCERPILWEVGGLCSGVYCDCLYQLLF